LVILNQHALVHREYQDSIVQDVLE